MFVRESLYIKDIGLIAVFLWPLHLHQDSSQMFITVVAYMTSSERMFTEPQKRLKLQAKPPDAPIFVLSNF